MWKKVLGLSTAAMLVGTVALAQQPNVGMRDGIPEIQPWRPSADDFAAFTDARVAALKAGLRLTSDQEKNWPAFEQAYRNLAKLRADRFAANRDASATPGDQNLVDRLQRRADSITQFGTALQDLAKATRPLYQSLDDAQKHRFVAINRFMMQHRHFAMAHGFGPGEHHGMGERPHGMGDGPHGGMMGHGFGRPDGGDHE
jgi:zinc resistance-associated protein